MNHFSIVYPADGWPMVSAALAVAVLAGGAVPTGNATPNAVRTLPKAAMIGTAAVAPAPALAASAGMAVQQKITPAVARTALVAAPKPYFVRIELPTARPAQMPAAQPAAALAAASAALPAPLSATAPVLTPPLDDARVATSLVLGAAATTPAATELVDAVGRAQVHPVAPAEPAMPTLLAERGFDLADLAPGKASPTPKLLPTRAAPPKASSRKVADTVIDGAILHTMTLRIGTEDAGGITVRIADEGGPQVKLADLLAKVASGMDPELHARLSVAGAAQSYVSFAQLRTAGFEVRYDAAADTVVLDTPG